jgi:hypothetical protein
MAYSNFLPNTGPPNLVFGGNISPRPRRGAVEVGEGAEKRFGKWGLCGAPLQVRLELRHFCNSWPITFEVPRAQGQRKTEGLSVKETKTAHDLMWTFWVGHFWDTGHTWMAFCRTPSLGSTGNCWVVGLQSSLCSATSSEITVASYQKPQC